MMIWEWQLDEDQFFEIQIIQIISFFSNPNTGLKKINSLRNIVNTGTSFYNFVSFLSFQKETLFIVERIMSLSSCRLHNIKNYYIPIRAFFDILAYQRINILQIFNSLESTFSWIFYSTKLFIGWKQIKLIIIKNNIV